MFIAWTAVANRDDAERLAASIVEHRLAACVQIDGPIASHFLWEGKNGRIEEFRLTFKCLPAQLAALEAHVLARHAYTTPEWVVVRAEYVSEKYLSWARGDVHSPTL